MNHRISFRCSLSMLSPVHMANSRGTPVTGLRPIRFTVRMVLSKAL
jgi:hypothetical protein